MSLYAPRFLQENTENVVTFVVTPTICRDIIQLNLGNLRPCSSELLVIETTPSKDPSPPRLTNVI
jgi:hypothetical protein